MENKKKIVLLSFILIFMISIIPINVNGQTYYNWVLNSGFEDISGSEMISNGNAENGFNDGWSIYLGTPEIDTAYYYSSTKCFKTYDSGDKIIYNFSTPVSTASILNITFYTRTSSTSNLYFEVIYDDATNDADYVTVGSSFNEPYTGDDGYTWGKFGYNNFFDLAEGKNIVAILLYATGLKRFDDISCQTIGLGQSVILGGGYSAGGNPIYGTLPWFDDDYGDYYQSTDWQNITDEKSHSGDWSLRETADSDTWDNPYAPNCRIVYQEMYFLPTNLIEEYSVYLSTNETGSNRVLMGLYFTDGTWSQTIKDVALNSSQWVKLDVTDELVPTDDKILRSIYFQPLYNGRTVYFDDFSLLSTVPAGQLTFDWTLSPPPHRYGNTDFDSLYGKEYIFYGYVYDLDGNLTENGTAQIVMTGVSFQSTVVNVTNGEFNFTITERPYAVIQKDEYFDIDLILDERNLNIDIIAHWYPEFTTPTPSTTSSADIWDSNNASGFLTGGLIGGFVVTLVLTLLFGLIAHRDGIFAGLMLGTFISSIAGLFPLYGLILTVIFGALLIVSHTGFSTTTNGGN